MADPKTLRVLSLDGGGMRGYIESIFLELFIQQWGIEQNALAQNFDIIAGTSVGGIQTVAYANGFTPAQMQSFFVDDGPWIFSTSTIVPGVRASTLDKVSVMLLGGSFYDNTNLLDKLEEEFGDQTLPDMDTNVLIPSWDKTNKGILYYSNVNFPGSTGHTELSRNVAAATSSAPLYFPPVNFNSIDHWDAGIFQNNPVMTALTVGKTLKPAANRFCILRVGTGRGKLGFDDTGGPFSNMYNLMEIFEIGIAGPAEAAAIELGILDSYTLEDNFTYQFQFDIDPEQDSDIDNSSSDFLEYMHDATVANFNENIDEITNFIGHLTA